MIHIICITLYARIGFARMLWDWATSIGIICNYILQLLAPPMTIMNSTCNCYIDEFCLEHKSFVHDGAMWWFGRYNKHIDRFVNVSHIIAGLLRKRCIAGLVGRSCLYMCTCGCMRIVRCTTTCCLLRTTASDVTHVAYLLQQAWHILYTDCIAILIA